MQTQPTQPSSQPAGLAPRASADGVSAPSGHRHSGANPAPVSFSGRARIEISAPLKTAGDSGITERMVTVKLGKLEYSSRMFFQKVNGLAKWAFGECSEEAANAINEALGRKGEKAIAQML